MKFDTDYPADSVEFCTSQEHENVFVCGTYKLIEATGENVVDEDGKAGATKTSPSSSKCIGKCILLKVSDNGENYALDVLQELEMPAIPDMKWSAHSPLLAVADTEGRVTLLNLKSNETLQEVQRIHCRAEDILCLSLDWSNRRSSNELGSLAVSSSDGYLSMLVPHDGTFAVESTWLAHDFEAWIAAWNYWDTNILYSGGDDLKLKGWDVRQGPTHPVFVNKRFDAGVTSIQSHPHIEHIVAVGSYDASVRIFDMRNPIIPVTKAEVGGGAWRVRWHPGAYRSTDLLVACMYDGFKIVRFGSSVLGSKLNGEYSDWEITKSFSEHESLAYGVDWSIMQKRGTKNTVIASCSFYDHVLHTWEG